MLDTLLKWIAAGDQAINGMGPVIAIAIALLGASGFTQLLKFPLVELVPDKWEKWTIRLVAIGSTFALLHWLSDLRTALELSIACLQPYAYSAAMAIMRRRWPWLEATRAAGSVRPSDTAVEALTLRKDAP